MKPSSDTQQRREYVASVQEVEAAMTALFRDEGETVKQLRELAEKAYTDTYCGTDTGSGKAFKEFVKPNMILRLLEWVECGQIAKVALEKESVQPSSALIAGMEAALEVCQRVEASLKEGGLREQSFGAGDCVANLNLKLGALDRSASSSIEPSKLQRRGVLRFRANLAWTEFREKRVGLSADEEKAQFLDSVTDAMESCEVAAPSAIVPPREPTQAMYDAAKIIILPSYRGQLDNQHAYDIVSKEDMAALWQAMYDEAISRRDGGANRA